MEFGIIRHKRHCGSQRTYITKAKGKRKSKYQIERELAREVERIQARRQKKSGKNKQRVKLMDDNIKNSIEARCDTQKTRATIRTPLFRSSIRMMQASGKQATPHEWETKARRMLARECSALMRAGARNIVTLD